MKILQTIAGFGAHSGGTSTCTYDLISALHQINCDVDLMSIASPDLMGKGESWIKALPYDYISSYGYSRNMNHFLEQSDYDLYHTNGMWMHCNHETCLVARRKNKPYIITPHGMLYPQALARSTWKKKLLLNFGGVNKDLLQADCIHVTCQEEMKHYRELGFKNPVAVIPNPVPIPEFINEIKPDHTKKRIGYLGRLHPYKRPDALIEAWIQLGEETKNAELLIIGCGTKEYENYLQQIADSSYLHNIKFLGLKTGKEKFELLSSFTALCVPSKTENFGMTVAESLISQTPVICTNTAPWESLNTYNCGWWVNNDVNTLAESIKYALSLSPEALYQMGKNGKTLVEEKYRDIKVAGMMKQLYEWILSNDNKPDFVYI